MVPGQLGLIRAEAPDLVLMDVMMPHVDGFEACRALKKDLRGYSDRSRPDVVRKAVVGAGDPT